MVYQTGHDGIVQLQVLIEGESYQIQLPNGMLEEAQEFFQKMDRDMDGGWQMSREYVENPNQLERCQIAADKLYTAIEMENKTLAELMAGYILSRMPGVVAVDIDVTGEMQSTEFTLGPGPQQRAQGTAQGGLSKLEAIEQAGQDVSKVYSVGRSYRYAVYDRAQDTWMESPLFDRKEEADASRMQAVKQRFAELVGE